MNNFKDSFKTNDIIYLFYMFLNLRLDQIPAFKIVACGMTGRFKYKRFLREETAYKVTHFNVLLVALLRPILFPLVSECT